MKHILAFLSCIFISYSFSQIPNYVPSDGLVGWWPFNGNANDESGNQNNGIINGASLTQDRFAKVNSAYSFDGLNDFISINNSSSLNITGSQITISFWLFNQKNDNMHKGISKGGWDVGCGFEFLYSDNNTIQLSGAYGGLQRIDNNPLNILNKWDHLVAVFNNGVGFFYVNGTKVDAKLNGNQFKSFVSCDYPLIFGKRSDQNFNLKGFVHGKMDDIGIWKRALTEAEILALYNNKQNETPINCELARKSYLEKYPDVKANGADPWAHYTLYGKNEGRIWPSCETVVSKSVEENCESARKEYLEKNPDVKKAGIDPWTHFIYYGKNEGRVWSPCVEDENSKIITEEDMKILFGDDNTNKSYYDVYKLGNKGVENGFGVLELSEGNVYRGNFLSHQPSGYGEWYFTNGDVYKGEFVNGKFQGNGKYFFNNGDVKDAVWENGKEIKQISYQYGNLQAGGCVSGNCNNGFGKYIYANGTYEGNFLNGQWMGKGKHTFTNGDVYEGEFKGFKRNGFGMLKWANGKKYEGNWVDGKVEGQGTYYYLDGSKYIGNFSNYVRTGYGIYYYSDGSIYSGNWTNGKMNGQGKREYPSGKIEEGIFENDKFISQNSSSSVVLGKQNTSFIYPNDYAEFERIYSSMDSSSKEKYLYDVINLGNQAINDKELILIMAKFSLINFHILSKSDKITSETWTSHYNFLKTWINYERFEENFSSDNRAIIYYQTIYCGQKASQPITEFIRRVVNEFTSQNFYLGSEIYDNLAKSLRDFDENNSKELKLNTEVAVVKGISSSFLNFSKVLRGERYEYDESTDDWLRYSWYVCSKCNLLKGREAGDICNTDYSKHNFKFLCLEGSRHLKCTGCGLRITIKANTKPEFNYVCPGQKGAHHNWVDY